MTDGMKFAALRRHDDVSCAHWRQAEIVAQQMAVVLREEDEFAASVLLGLTSLGGGKSSPSTT
jgi:hypothetical protein